MGKGFRCAIGTTGSDISIIPTPLEKVTPFSTLAAITPLRNEPYLRARYRRTTRLFVFRMTSGRGV